MGDWQTKSALWVGAVWLAGSVLSGCGAPSRVSAADQPGSGKRFDLQETLGERDKRLFFSYAFSKGLPMAQAAIKVDPRPPEEILKELRALPLPRLVGLQNYVLASPWMGRPALKAMEEVFPSGQRDLLLKAVQNERFFSAAAAELAETGDPSVVGPILDQAEVQTMCYLDVLARPEFLDEVRRIWSEARTPAAATAIGCFGHAAEKEVRLTASTTDPNVRNAVLYGLSISPDKNALSLLLSLADVESANDQSEIENRIEREGAVHVPQMVQWLDGTRGQEAVAAHALAHIASDEGVEALLRHFEVRPEFESFCSPAAKSSPDAARAFVIRCAVGGPKARRMNALALAHQLSGYANVTPEREDPVLDALLRASHDEDAEVRYASLGPIHEFAYDAHYSSGMKALLRFVAMMRDESARVRGEAAVQASQYPCPQVLDLLRKMADDVHEDENVRDATRRASASLAERLRSLAGSGQTAVSLRGS